MFVMRYRHFRVYVNPLIALIELIIISYIVRTIPFLDGLGFICFVLGLSLGQSAKSAYKQMMTARLFSMMRPKKSFRKEVSNNAIW
jgi:hypothetical protein